MRNIILLQLIILIGACSSIPKNDQNNTINTLIEKPDFNYKIRSLPSELNLFYFQEGNNETLPSEVEGFLANAYFYNEKISYKPKVRIIKVKDTKCTQNPMDTFSIILDLKRSEYSPTNISCLNNSLNSNTFYISNKRTNLNVYKYNFIISRESEREALIDQINDRDIRFAVLDTKETNDAQKLITAIEARDKKVIETATHTKNVSSQDLFAGLLMADRSKERIRKLSRRLGTQITGDSRVRDDIDSIFISAGLKEARNLKPALDYISGKDYKVLILNSWKVNEAYNLKDVDLFHTLNSDMPIMMPIRLPQFIPKSKETRNFAIGYDSFEILMLIFSSVNKRDFVYKGLTGKIKLGQPEIERKPYVFKLTNEGLEIL